MQAMEAWKDILEEEIKVMIPTFIGKSYVS